MLLYAPLTALHVVHKIQFRNRISISVPVLSLKNRRDRKRGSVECEKDPLDPDPRFPWLGPEPAAAVGTVCFTDADLRSRPNPTTITVV